MKIDILDKGYIELVDTLGDDLTPVNAARVSFGGRSETFESKDRKLSKLQEYRIKELKNYGFKTEVYRGD